MYELWYDYIKQKYGEKAKFCYMGIDSFIEYMSIGDNLGKSGLASQGITLRIGKILVQIPLGAQTDFGTQPRY